MIDHLAREKLLFRYGNALSQGDFDSVSAVLEAARDDPELERAILELHQAYLIEMQNGTASIDDSSSPKEIRFNVRPANKPSWNPPFTLAVAAMITILFSALLIVNGLRNRTDSTGVYRSVEEVNTSVFLRYLEEAWNQGNVDTLDDVLTPDHVRHDSGFPEDIVGIEASAQLITGFRTALPDLHLDIQDMTADGNQVWAYVFLSGTHTGLLTLPDGTNVPPTGAAVSIRMMLIGRFVNSKIAELRAEYDSVDWLQQVGVMPALQQLATEAQNVAIARRVIDDLWNGENLNDIANTVRELYAMPSTFHQPGNLDTSETLAGWIYTFQMLHGGFPDMRVTIDHISAQADRVIVHYTFQGTHEGYIYFPPNVEMTGTRESVAWEGVIMYRIQDGKIVEEWWYWNNEYVTRANYAGCPYLDEQSCEE